VPPPDPGIRLATVAAAVPEERGAVDVDDAGVALAVATLAAPPETARVTLRTAALPAE